MKLKEKCKLLCIASILIFVIGVIRGIGGVINLINNTDILVGTNISSIVLVLLTIFLIFLSAATIITAIGVYEHNEKFIVMGIVISALFLVYSIIKAHLLFQNTLSNNTIINSVSAIAVISLLVLGKRMIDKTKRRL